MILGIKLYSLAVVLNGNFEVLFYKRFVTKPKAHVNRRDTLDSSVIFVSIERLRWGELSTLTV